MDARRGFTLMEIMLAVGLIGIIAAAALAPLVFTVRSLEDAQTRWGASHNTSSAFDKLYSDVRRVIPNPSFSSFKIVHKSGPTADERDDRLVIWSTAPKYEGKGTGVVIYKVLRDEIADDTKPGLYRWVYVNIPSGGVTSADFSAMRNAMTPMEMDTDKLDPHSAKLLLADVTGLKFFVRDKDEWAQQDYIGGIPEFLRTEIISGDATFTRTERFPNASY